ncbi:MAG: carbamoyltransferase HypF [Candidatus Jordarchaeaceae archaeon]
MKASCEINCSGIVQGVGMRPFVYRLAVKWRLVGYVQNLGDAGVRIVVEGEKNAIENFIQDLKREKPPMAVYEKISVKWGSYQGRFKKFTISRSSKASALKSSHIPPDISICDKCLNDILNPTDRHYKYPFTCCADCGPRFTSIIDLPYDRMRTTMKDFPLCSECEQEYDNPLDRRYHAQGICCPKCGPRLVLYDREGSVVNYEDPITDAANIVKEGKILAIKGIGGTHLATLTTDDECILELRRRKRDRRYKPFAIMSLNLDKIREYAILDEYEEEIISSFRRPIVLLKKSENYDLSEWISPGLHNVGVMLPYSGLHYLILQKIDDPAIVMTSGNTTDTPMSISNDEIISRLGHIADYFLLHNREIYQRADDSVIKIINGKTKIIRRSRGFVPEPIDMILEYRGKGILAVGPELTATISVMKRNRCYPSQHIGNLSGDLETIEFHENVVNQMLKLTLVEPDAVACDLHPNFYTTRYAEKFADTHNIELVRVQHHHAHAAKLMAENNITEPIICITSDGVGYGQDGTIWGGEILLVSYNSMERLAHLKPQPMPGGDISTKYPTRMLTAILSEAIPENELRQILVKNYIEGFKYGQREMEVVFSALRKKEYITTTSSGRVLDSISALLKICLEKTYEGEPAIRLESIATKGKDHIKITPEINKQNGKYVFDTTKLLSDILEKLNHNKIQDLAASGQRAFAEGLAQMAITTAEETGVKIIGFTGGVAYNEAINNIISKLVKENNLKFVEHQKIPPGDAGISLGQAVIAAAKLNDTIK